MIEADYTRTPPAPRRSGDPTCVPYVCLFPSFLLLFLLRRLDYLRGLSSKERVRNVCDDHLRIMERPPPPGLTGPEDERNRWDGGAWHAQWQTTINSY